MAPLASALEFGSLRHLFKKTSTPGLTESADNLSPCRHL
jgi:hypothetical protein